MATVAELQRLIGRITRRADDANFSADSLDGMNEGLQEIFKIYPLREAVTSVTISVLQGEVSTTLASSITPLTITSIRAAKSDNDYYPIRFKSLAFMDRAFPNRTDTDKDVELSHIARKGSTLVFNGSVNDGYTLEVDVLSSATALVEGGSNLYAVYDQALVHYASYWIFSILEQEPQANRQMQLYERALGLTIKSDSHDHATINKFGMRPLGGTRTSIIKPTFLDSDLESL